MEFNTQRGASDRGDVYVDGDYHRAAHVCIFAESTQELLLQKRADCKDSFPGLWDLSGAGHISAGDSSLITARRELHEELGVTLPNDAFELIFSFLQECVMNEGKYINNEVSDVYLVTTLAPIPLEAFCLQESEVSVVRYMPYEEYKSAILNEDPQYVPYYARGHYGQLFYIIEQRFKSPHFCFVRWRLGSERGYVGLQGWFHSGYSDCQGCNLFAIGGEVVRSARGR